MHSNHLSTRRLWLTVTSFFALAGYFLGLRPFLDLQTASLIEMALLGGLLAALVGAVLLIVVGLLVRLFGRTHSLGGPMYFLLAMLGLLILFTAVSQLLAYTPPILGNDGKPLPGSIAALEKVRLGGKDQWLILRGQDVNKPVLLFLSGGPGASEAARVTRFNHELEKDFVVVIWEQRGCGKSYLSHYPKSALTLEQYVSDLIELTDLLRTRFDEQKIYLVGHSWGSIIGVQAAQARPDLFHAYIGTSQMVDVLETDQVIYQLVLDHALRSGDTGFVNTLEAIGEPPYFGKNPIRPYSTLFGREYAVFEYPNIQDEAYRQDGDILMLMLKQPEYGWLDRVYYLLGLMNTFNVVYPQLQDLDLRSQAASLDLPVYLILGRHDMNNPSQIPEEYFNLLQAPHKQLFYFEKSGHGMIWEEASLFHEILANTVVPETYRP